MSSGTGEPTGPILENSQLVAWLRLDQTARWRRGQRALAEDYLGQHPALARDPDAALELIYNEIVIREERGEAPDLSEYVRRFPHLAAELSDQFQVHRALEFDTFPEASSSRGTGPSGDCASITPADELPSVIGYEVLGVLGHGGLGVVYRARQTRLNRLVALKMVLAGARAGPDDLARFRREAEVVAGLQHPNIVQIYEVGEHEGCPYLSLEYVNGGTLADKLGDTPQPSGEAARLVETLARAVHFAHLRGVVHRDLKPANILLQINPMPGRKNAWQDKGKATAPDRQATPNPCIPSSPGRDAPSPWSEALPKITDFGLAKRLDDVNGPTQAGQVLGTPDYMAPEQAGGRADTVGPAADLYGLGAVLYRLLTGRPPFRGESPGETVLQVLFEEPVPPRRLQPKVPRDLQTICLKCLQKEPSRRYHDAEALAADLQRFLAGEPIQARPVSLGVRAVKWAKRRPGAAAFLAVSILAAAALTGLGAWSYEHLRAAAVREKERADEARAERRRADARSRLARQAVDDMYTEVAEQWLANEPHKDALQQRFLQKALQVYEELSREEDADADVRRETALASFRLGQIFRELGQSDRAEGALNRAIELQQRLSQETPDSARLRQDLANSHNWLGELLRTGGRRLVEAEQSYVRARALQARLVADFPDVAPYQRELARSDYNLGIVRMDLGRPGEARECFDRAIERLDGLATRFVSEPDYRQELARATLDRGVLLRNTGSAGSAEEDYRRAIDLLGRLQEQWRDRPAYRLELAAATNNLGNLLAAPPHPRYSEARRAHEQALVLLGQLVTDYPDRPTYRWELANARNSLGRVLAEQKQIPHALENWEQSRELFRQLATQAPEVADYQHSLGMTLNNIAWLYLGRNELETARRKLEESLDHLLVAVRLNPDHPDYAKTLQRSGSNLAKVLVRQGHQDEAMARAATLSQSLSRAGQGPWFAARFLASCAAEAEKIAGAEIAERYVDQAVAELRRAEAAGYGAKESATNDPLQKILRRAESREHPER